MDNTANAANAQLNQTAGSAGDTISAPLLLNSSLDITNLSAPALTLSGGITANTAGVKTITTSTGAVTLSGIVGNGTGTVAVTQNGAGTLTLTAANTYSGGTTLSGGTLAITGNTTVTGGVVAHGPVGTGTIALNGGTFRSSSTAARTLQNSLSLSGTVTLGDATNNGPLTFNSASLTTAATATLNGNTTLSTASAVTIDNVISGSSSLTKDGSSTLTFSGGANNTYSGKTTVNNGTVILSKSITVNAVSSTGSTGANAANTDLQILTGGTVQLNARDQIINTAKVGLSGGTLNLNGNSEGSATVSGGTTTSATVGVGALTLSSTSTINFGATSGSNKLVFAGVGTHTGGAVLQITNWEGKRFTGSGNDQLLFSGTSNAFTSQYSQSDVTFNGITGYAVDQFSGFYEVTAVPEASTWAAGALALFAAGYTQRRRLLKKAGIPRY